MNDGIPFERTVESWLHRRGARMTERRVPLRGRVAQRTHECDVHATMIREVWRPAAAIGAFFAFACIGGGLADELMMSLVSGILGLACLVLTTVIFLDPKHIWVEAKSGEATITRAVVWKLANQLEDVRNAPAALWYPSEAWIVARSPFDVDALAFAHEHGIRCFQEQRGRIHEVS